MKTTGLTCHFCEKPITETSGGLVFLHDGRGHYPTPGHPEPTTECVVAHSACSPDSFGYCIEMIRILPDDGTSASNGSKEWWIDHIKRKNWTDTATLFRFACYAEAILALRDQAEK